MFSTSRRTFLATAAAFAATPCMGQVTAAPFGSVRKLDAGLDALIAPDTVVEKLADGITWAEGPVWVKNGEYLLFSDVPGNIIHRWSDASGLEVFMQPSGLANPDPAKYREPGSNGLVIGPSGKLFMADSGSRALASVDLKTKKKRIFLDRFEGKRFNSPNDLVFSRSGAIYFTDPPYGLVGVDKSPLREMGFNGVYRRDKSGKVTVIDKTLKFPNGVGLSPDEKTLYVSNSDPAMPIIRAYKLGAHGLPTSSSTFFDASKMIASDAPGSPDGMKIDAAGNLFGAGPGGIMVITPAGKLLGVIGSSGGRPIANCAFGEDGSTLFLTSKDSLLRIRTKTRGLGWA